MGGGGGWVVRERIDNSSLPFFFRAFDAQSNKKELRAEFSLSLSRVCVCVRTIKPGDDDDVHRCAACVSNKKKIT